ncbi:hypothetical protein J8TS2_27850 [Lederbergia ruris]|uniref:Uncharacterized protein n=1 Tax=Lederbergia ruris TaxID=217495 RepID=A0ABQ4KLW3_9BACI|nr:hypothetical protein J8TS2_27850 [Lederbergia ruris]
MDGYRKSNHEVYDIKYHGNMGDKYNYKGTAQTNYNKRKMY